MRKLALAALLAAPLVLCPLAASADGVFGVNGCGTSQVQPGLGAYLTVDQNTGNQCTGSGAPYQSTPLGYQQIVGAVTSTALTVPMGATFAIITVEGQSVRWRDDGVAPTASVGFPLSVNSQLTYSSATGLVALRFIQTAATATIDVEYYK